MTAGHAPHTPPMWRRFLSLPHTRQGWWAVGLAAPALVLTVYFPLSVVFGWMFLRPAVAETGSSDQYPILILAWILSALAGGVIGSLALGAAERSLLVWLAQVPTALSFAFFTSFFLGEGNYPPWVAPSLGVLFWAVIALGVIYLMRSAQRNNVRWFE